VYFIGSVDVCLNHPFDFAQGAFLRWLSGVEASFDVVLFGFFRKNNLNFKTSTDPIIKIQESF